MLWDVLYRPDALHRVAGGEHVGECFPGDYPGQVTAVKKAGTWGEPHVRAPFRVVRMELTEDERMGLSGHTLKVVGTSRPEVAGVTFDDEFGAIAPDIPAAFRNAMEDEKQLEASLLDKDQETLTNRRGLYDAVRGYTEHLTRQLPGPDVHTGTGLYAVKAAPTHLDRAQSGPAVGQTITLSAGGLGVADAYKGGYIVNATEAETRAIVSHTDNTVTLEGNLANWSDLDDLDIYDAWATVQGAADQLFVDQAAALFGAEQYIEIYDGTYDENVQLNTGLIPNALYPLYFKAASGEVAVILTNASQGANSTTVDINAVPAVYVSDLEFRNVKGTGYALDTGTQHGCRVSRCLFEGSNTASRGLYPAYSVLVEDCTIQGFTGHTLFTGGYSYFRRCSFHGGTFYRTVSVYVVVFDSCVFDSIDHITVRGATTTAPPRVSFIVRHCVFYNCADVFDVDASNVYNHISLQIRNCIFHTISGYVFNAEINTGLIDSNYNCFFSCAKVAKYESVDYDTLAAWQAYTDIDGNSPDANSVEADPLLTNPGADDFTLQALSPCRKAGAGAGVALDRAGAAFDPYHPDQGAYSSGVVGATPGTPSAEYMSQGLNVHVHLDGNAGYDNYARLIDKDGAVADEDSITGDGSVGLVAATPGPHAVVAWSADGDDIVRSKPTTVFPFECLTFAVPGATVQFELGPDQVVLTAPVPGPTERDVHHDASLLTAAGVRFAYDKGVERQELELTFESLTESEKIDLKDFYDRVAEGVVNLFQYTDSNGTLYSARFLEPTLEFTRVAVGVYDVSLLLELVEIT